MRNEIIKELPASNTTNADLQITQTSIKIDCTTRWWI
jgi:hypothetical protein